MPSTTQGMPSVSRTATTTIQTSTPVTLLQACESASNLTQSWRLEYNGDDIRGGGPNSDPSAGYACDYRSSLQWFRFTADAGDKIMDFLEMVVSLNNK